MRSVAPLRIRRFRLLWLASVFSNIGSFLQAVAASWLMLELTGSPLWVGAMAASTTLPLLFLALPAGAMADLIERRRIVLSSQMVMGAAALSMAVLWYADLASPGGLLGLGLVMGVGVAFNLPAWQSMVPELVPRGLVASAVALNSVAFNVARAVGPALGGAIVALAGPGLAFALNALSYLGVITVLALLRFEDHGDDAGRSLSAAIGLGVRFARFTPPLRRLLAVAAGFAITSAVVQSLLPNLIDEVFRGGATAYGLLLGAMGVGALAGAFSRAPVAERLGGRHVPASIAGFGLAGLATGLAPRVELAAVSMFVAGVFWVWTLSTLNATVQLLVPGWVRGRAASLYTLAFVGILPLGSLLAGVIGDLFTTPVAYVTLSLGTLALALAGSRIGLPVLGEVVTPEPADDWEVPDHPDRVEGGPVMLVNTWLIDEDDLAPFLEVMNELRQVRLRTGAYRWRLYRNVGDPHRMTEVFLLGSWEDHLGQHRRLDTASANIIRRARAFDRGDGPVTRHLVAVDVIDPAQRPEWDQLLAQHDELHGRDGSIPLPTHGDSPDR